MSDSKLWARLWGALLLLSVMGLADIPSSTLIDGPVASRWCLIAFIAAFKATFITFALYICRKRRLIETALGMLTVFYAIFAIVNFISFSLYGFGITTRLMSIISQTNRREFMEFVPTLGGDISRALTHPATWVAILSACAFVYIVPKLMRLRYAKIVLLTMNVAGVAVICFCLSTFSVGKNTLFLTLRVSKNIHHSIEEHRTLKELEKMRRPFPDSDRVTSTCRAANVIIAIGESAARDHHSLYGYPLPTTPFLDSIRDDLFIFRDALASGTATAQNMECILSFKSDNDSTVKWSETPWLVDLFRNAGYKAFWLSNQEKAGLWSNPSAVMVSDADVINYVGAANDNDHTLDKYDSSLIPPFDEAICDTVRNKLICLHLAGSHFLYSRRYPPEYNLIGSEDILALHHKPWLTVKKASTVAEYDNSIRFTDSILKHLIVSASRTQTPAILIYFSDHGEILFDNNDFRGRDRTSVRVPFIIYANKSYRNENPDIIERLENATDKKFSTSDLIHLLMSLSGISYPMYDSTKDISSEEFVPRQRYVDNTAWEYDRL